MKRITLENTSQRELFSLAVRTLSDKGFDNEAIATVLDATRSQVGAVMAWHKHRASWER